MSIESQLNQFYENIRQNFVMMQHQDTFKIVSSETNFDNVILLNDTNQDVKPYLSYLGKYEQDNNFVHTVKYKYYDDTQLIIKSHQWVDKRHVSIISIEKIN